MLGWMRRKLFILFRRLSFGSEPICVSKLLQDPQGVLIVLPRREEEFGKVTRWVRRWMGQREGVLVVSSFFCANRSTICCDELIPSDDDFRKLKGVLDRRSIDMLIDLSDRPQDRSRMISLLSGARLRVASFSDPPFFNCQIRTEGTETAQSIGLLKVLEECFARGSLP